MPELNKNQRDGWGMKKQICAALLLGTVFNVQFFSQSKTALDLFNSGLEFEYAENYFAAVEKYREALNNNPDYGDAYFHLAQCSFELGDYDLALEYTVTAEKYSKDYNKIRNLRGFTLISLGKMKEARQTFEDVLKQFPNDVDARFGLAQLDLYDGRLSSAEDKYIDALKRQNTNKTALLSLALVSAETGKNDLAQDYISKALEFHSGEPLVHYLAAYLLNQRGELEQAEGHARSAVQLKSDYDRAWELLGTILFNQKRFEEAIDICDYRLNQNRNLSSAWYVKGLAQEKLGRTEDALDTYTKGLLVAPKDEVMRASLEQLIAREVPMEDKRRSGWAQYHVKRALEYKRCFDNPGERYEYIEALKINPFDNETRQNFADLLNREGYNELYLHQLEFIEKSKQEIRDEEIRNKIKRNEDTPTYTKTYLDIKNEDAIEALKSMKPDLLSYKWEVDPFYLEKNRYKIGIFYNQDQVQIYHPEVERVTALALEQSFSGIAGASVVSFTNAASSFGQAYRIARENKCDYFAVIQFDETDRAMNLDVKIYSGRTGTVTSSNYIYRTGNDRYSSIIRRFRQAVLDILPIRGKVIRYTGGSILADLGKSDGISVGAVFDVVKQNSIYTVDKGPGIAYPKDDILGTFTVETVNEEICQGTFKKIGFYDLLSENDDLVLISNGGELTPLDGSSQSDTRPQADSKGKPATRRSKKAESEETSYSLKTARERENRLISLIRSIR